MPRESVRISCPLRGGPPSPSFVKRTRAVLKQGASERGVDEPRSPAPPGTCERRPPGRIRKERVGERDRVTRTHAQATPSSEVVDRPRDDSKPHTVELAEERRDLARQRSVHEGLEEDRLRPILALVHRDELAEDGIRALTARTPPLDTADQTFSPSPQRRVDETFFCRRVQVDRAGSDVSASCHLADP